VAKTRAQRKAERRAREARAAREAERQRDADSRAQQRTQVPETAYEAEAELAEEGADLDELTGGDGAAAEAAVEAPAEPAPAEAPERPRSPAPSRADVGAPAEEAAPDRVTRRQRRREERERQRRAKESERRRQAPTAAKPERQRGAVIGFFISCWAELKRVQWPDRETLIQASAVTVIFIAIAAAYLGALDALFNWIVQRIL
jgi:preprotein translocase SecE subunit